MKVGHRRGALHLKCIIYLAEGAVLYRAAMSESELLVQQPLRLLLRYHAVATTPHAESATSVLVRGTRIAAVVKITTLLH